MKLSFVLLLPVLIFFTSCASLLNGPTIFLNVNADHKVNLRVGDSLYVVEGLTRVEVERSPADLPVSFSSDSVSRDVVLKSRTSLAWYSNILLFGIGLPIDAQSNSRYAYQKYLYINRDDSLQFFKPDRKGQLRANVSIPYVNSFYLHPAGYSGQYSMGFWGITGGLEYHWRKGHSVGLSAELLTNYPLPVPAPVYYDEGLTEKMFSQRVAVMRYQIFGKFRLGYGLGYSVNRLERIDAGAISDTGNIRSRNNSLGLTFSGHYRFSRVVYGGLVYRPGLWEIRPENRFNYEHVISLDLLFRW